MGSSRAVVAGFVAIAAVGCGIAVGCTLLAPFDDEAAPKDDDVVQPLGDDGVAPAESSTGDDAPASGDDDASAVQDVTPAEDVVVDADAETCTGKPEGFNWNAADPLARCCDGGATLVKTNQNCGVCGVRCDVAAGQQCATQNGHYMCRGCSASTQCWAGCCSTTYSPHNCTPNSPCANGTCSDALCAQAGGATAKCMTQANGSNYCAYP